MIFRIIRIVKRNLYVIREKKTKNNSAKFAHITYCTVGNVGDNVLSYFTRLAISKIVIPYWDIIPINKTVTSYTIKSLNRNDAIFIGGGGLFLPDTNANNISGWQWAISNEQLEQIHRPLLVFAVGYNYFKGQKNTDLFKNSVLKLVESASFFSLRNHGSIQAIKQIIPSDLHDRLIYQPCVTTIIRKLLPYIPQKTITKNIAFNMAFDREERRFGEKREEVLDQVAQAAKAIQDKGYKIVYIAHCIADLKFVPYLKKHCKNVEIINMDGWLPDKLLNIYNNMDVVIGMRGHAQMIPFGLNCEIISLGTHDKLKWFLQDIDAMDWYIDLQKERNIKEKILDTFTNIHEVHYDETKKRLNEQQEKLYHITENNIKQIFNILSKAGSVHE